MTGLHTWLGRGFATVYIVSVTAAVAGLAWIGDTFLAGWLACIEVASVITISWLTRKAPSGPSRTTRLGTPNDPGMPSGRTPPRLSPRR